VYEALSYYSTEIDQHGAPCVQCMRP
jgi:hypothetical protein